MPKLENVVLGLLCVSILTPLFATNVQAASVTISTPSKDTRIISGIMDWNYGSDPELELGDIPGLIEEYRILVQFDLPPALSGASIISATLGLYFIAPWTGASPTGEFVRVCRVTHDWGEGTGLWGTNSKDGVTWNEYNYFDGLTTAANNWATPGGDFTLTDSSTVVFPPLPVTWVNWTVTSIVQGWASGTYQNYGFLVKLEDESTLTTKGGSFSSKERTISPSPKLEITYETPTGVPEFTVTVPVVASLAAVAYLVLKKRISK